MNDQQPSGATPTTRTVDVTLGDHTVPVAAGGMYDRYRMSADLDEVARMPGVPGVEFFRSLPKTRVDSPIGPTMTPNFYYAMSSSRLILGAPSRAIRARLPRPLEPLEIAPGVGIVSVMLFRYDVTDVDPYTEAAVGVAVKPARHGPVGAIDTLAALKNQALDAYVFALPVSTEIAYVRGHDGYGLPKWVTPIDVRIDERETYGRIAADGGGVDVELRAPTPRQRRHRSGSSVTTMTSYTRRGAGWFETLAETNPLASGSRVLPRDVELTLGSGRMADEIRSLEPSRPLAFDVMTSGQLALHMPTVLSVA